jgi:N-methylhydantoinase A/oxoprolinase/acetone carboxylase beta subunit
MSAEFAYTRPVETLLCGPAASVMGSTCLAEEKNSIIIDMGGTTTDIALINNGLPHKVTDGIGIGKWKTCVGGFYIKTFGLGGDTAIHYDYDSKKAFLEDYRVVPLCVAAWKYPYIADNLKRLIARTRRHTRFLHEHYILVKDISNNPRYNDEEKIFCAALKDGPLILREAAASVPEKDIYNLNVSRLLKEGIIQMCGLTPTDIMHIVGDFNRFPVDASVLGARYVAANCDISGDALCDHIYDEIRRRIYVNVVKVMLENKEAHYMKNGVSKDVERFINESYDMAKTGFKHEFISMMFSTDFTLTGLGAPIHVFLGDVAKMLGTKAIIPEHYEVANALGAIMGNVYASNEVEIRPNLSSEGVSGYTVFGNTETRVFQNIEEAEEFAVTEAKTGAYREAVRRGARGEIITTCKLNKNEAQAKDCVIHLGTQAIAQAVGGVEL